MSETIVDDLETVDVQEQNGKQVILLSPRAPQRAFQVVDEQSPIRQPCKRIVQSIVDQLLLGPPPLGEVPTGRDNRDRAIWALNHVGDEQNRERGSIRPGVDSLSFPDPHPQHLFHR